MADQRTLNGLRVLVVEDSLLVAETIAETLASFGCEVVGPVARLGRALPVAREEPLDGAVLDVNLAGELSFPLAEILKARGIPFIFLTGYGDVPNMPAAFRHFPMVAKPFDSGALVDLIAQSFKRG